MKYYHNLYVSKELLGKKEEIIDKIEKNQWQLAKYLVVLTKNEQNHLEFFDSVLLIQDAIPKEDLFVIGIAAGYQGALEMIEEITREVYAATADVNIRGFLLDRQREYEESKA